jgi:hypothetical protein
MTLKIETNSDGRRILIRLIGRVRPEHIEELKKQTGAKDPPIVFDMECVTLVDIEVVRFLNACEKSGIELIHCSPYIREWMAREQVRKSTYPHHRIN